MPIQPRCHPQRLEACHLGRLRLVLALELALDERCEPGAEQIHRLAEAAARLEPGRTALFHYQRALELLDSDEGRGLLEHLRALTRRFETGLVERGCEVLGWRGGALRHNRTGCVGSGKSCEPCLDDGDCPPAMPTCNVAVHACVGCVDDGDCSRPTPVRWSPMPSSWVASRESRRPSRKSGLAGSSRPASFRRKSTKITASPSAPPA